MPVVFQSHFTTIVKTIDCRDAVVADSYYISTNHEAAGHIQANADDFLITNACWEVHRSPRSQEVGKANASTLCGQEAYFAVAPILKEAFAGVGAFQKELIAECVRGIIQAETYLYMERGYESPKSYDDAWEAMCLDSCRYYSHLDQVSKKWREHVGKQERQDYLFHRNKTCSVIANNANSLLLTGYFSDSFHQLAVAMTLTDGAIASCTGNLLRAPDKLCFETEKYLAGLVGMRVNELNKKAISQVIGGSQGCSHLVDLVNEMVRSLEEASSVE
jgi:hypothetical protein